MSATTDPTTRPSPLLDGDHLSADEFMRRYEATAEDFRAELIEGVVHVMNSPVASDEHGEPQFDIDGILALYKFATPGVKGSNNATLMLDADNLYQPDCILFLPLTKGGRFRRAGRYLQGAPELVVEVSASTVRIDMNEKLRNYARVGVREYIVWRTRDAEIDWFELKDERFESIPADADGVTHSRAFPGLWIDLTALVAGANERSVEVVSAGIASAEHAEFVERLRAEK